MRELDKRQNGNPEELMVSTLAIAEAVTKLLI
jgi:hypothetical protein